MIKASSLIYFTIGWGGGTSGVRALPRPPPLFEEILLHSVSLQAVRRGNLLEPL